MDDAAMEHFSRDPKVMGGRLCLAGTRVTVRAVELAIEAGWDDEKIMAAWPVTAEQIQFVRKHMGELRDAHRH